MRLIKEAPTNWRLGSAFAQAQAVTDNNRGMRCEGAPSTHSNCSMVPKFLALVLFVAFCMAVHTVAFASQSDPVLPSDTQTEELETVEYHSDESSGRDLTKRQEQNNAGSGNSTGAAKVSARADATDSRTTTAATADTVFVLMPVSIVGAASVLLAAGIIIKKC